MNADVQYEVNGLRLIHEVRDETSQPISHSHNEIELLLLEEGWGTWLMSGEVLTLKPGRLVAFWAVRPHQLVRSSPNMVVNCLTIPLTVFNEWKLPDSLAKPLLAGNAILDPEDDAFDYDRRLFHQWAEDLGTQDRNRHKAALLEIEARLMRLADRVRQKDRLGESLGVNAPLNHQYFEKISRIAEYVSHHFAEPLTIPEIARAVDMHPSSATKMFKKICGISLIHYLTQHRILHAQRLLMTSDKKVLDIALASGYRSASRFYAAYKKFCGVSPQRFRGSVDMRKVPLERKAGVLRLGRLRKR